MPRQLHTSQARAGVLLRVAAAAALLDGERKLQKAIMLLLNMRERTNAVSIYSCHLATPDVHNQLCASL